ncbi:MAG: hypothetical protein J6T26_00255 [Firmicutes bacterium]|nr:hypothetical protein [Bacillota bacterium]
MSLFRRNSARIDLSDQALSDQALNESAAEAADSGEPDSGREASDPVAPAEAPSEAPSEPAAEPGPEQEQRWQEAARSVAGHWPQVKADLPALLARMKKISESYGDPDLWQREPAGIMREAAVELYGMPSRPDDGALAQAVRAAHEQGRKAAADRRRALAGLAPPQISRSAPPPLTEEEKILRDMRQARKGRLF